jgi:predicted phage tail protein
MMKTIIFHGLLKKLFCKQVKLNVLNFKDIFKSLSCNYTDYHNKLNKLKKSCFGFAIIIDGRLFSKDLDAIDFYIKEANKIEIVPCSKFGFVTSLVAALVAIGLSKFWAAVVAIVVVAAISIGISFLISKLMGSKGAGNGIKTSSYIFGNKDNIAARNTPISVNYGRLRLGSNVINGLIVNFDLSYDASQILNNQTPAVGVTLASI